MSMLETTAALLRLVVLMHLKVVADRKVVFYYQFEYAATNCAEHENSISCPVVARLFLDYERDF